MIMNTSTTTNPGKKADVKKATMPAGTSTKPESCGNMHEGKIVSISGTKLVTSCPDGKEHSHTVAADAKVTCDGAVCRTEDLKAGSKIRLTTKPDDKLVAIKIESLKKHTEFAKSC